MKFFDIHKEDLIKYKHELILTICYTVALAIVYASWAYSELARAWVSVIISIAFAIAGVIFFIVWLYFLKKKEKAKEEK